MITCDTPDDQERLGVAIIGMACRFPDAPSFDELWRNLVDGVESIRPFTTEELAASGVAGSILNDPSYVNAGTVMPDADCFDASFFGINAREAEIMDPQHRVFLETAWQALEDAGYDPEDYQGAIGVFGGIAPNYYFQNNLATRPDLLQALGRYAILLGNEKEYAVTRVSYKLNLKGPSVGVNTACSTSGVAIHVACQSLLNGECDMALAGGAGIGVPLTAGYLYDEGGILSPDGHCRAFDAEARGTVGGKGVGIVVLRRLSDAVRNGDHIHAVILGSAVNNDGSQKVGFTAPSIQGQAAVISEALAMAGINPETISYVEAHGTGTSLGDPIEIAALTDAFRQWTDRKGYCPIGSVKTNIGHLDAGAGVAGVIKTVLALKHGQIPPSLNFSRPNPAIDFDSSPFYVNTRLSPWPAVAHPRRAGVSSFGLGGTNAHLILEEAPMTEPSGSSRPHQLLLLSARSYAALDQATRNLIQHLQQHPDVNLADVAYTLQTGRRTFRHRRSIVCEDVSDALSALGLADEPGRAITPTSPPVEREIVFMFSGQGSQYINMGMELYRNEPAFRAEIDRCSEILTPHLGLDLRRILYPDAPDQEEAAQVLQQTAFTQPALFTIEYALARLWHKWGVHPDLMVGHSIGEYVAATLAGVFTLEDALSLVAARGRLIQALPAGSMLAVSLPAQEIEPLLDGKLDLAVINAPCLSVVSGERQAVEALEQRLFERGIDCRRLHTSHAFHSSMMDPIIEEFSQQVERIRLSSPCIPFLSNVTGTWITPQEAASRGYWARHLRQTVRFSDCLHELLAGSGRVLLEVGPGRTLTSLAKQHPGITNEHLVLSSIRHPQEQKSDVAFMLKTLGQLWGSGVAIDWSGFYAYERRSRLSLPTYPFERKRYWIDPAPQAHTVVAGTPVPHTLSAAVASQEFVLEDESAGRTWENAPRDSLERSVAAIWQELLGIKQVGIHDDFFELGGDSLLATRVATELRRIHGVRLSIFDIFETPTVVGLAAAVKNAQSGETGNSWEQAEKDDLEIALRRLGSF